MSFTIADWSALAVVLLLALRGMSKGFVKEFTAKAGIIAGFTVALVFSELGLEVLHAIGTSMGDTIARIVVFALLFMAGLLIMRIVMSAVDSLIDMLHLEFADYVLGFALGAAEGALLVSVVVYLLAMQSVVPTAELFAQSQALNLIQPIAPAVLEIMRGPAAAAEGLL